MSEELRISGDELDFLFGDGEEEVEPAIYLWETDEDGEVSAETRMTLGEFQAMYRAAGEASCRSCGCTESAACEGGCYWVREDLCSNCAEIWEESPPQLGACCACEVIGPTVRCIIAVEKKAPIPGHGWGCFVCGLPADGAVYVLCDACFEAQRPPRFACAGWPVEDGRVPFESLAGEHAHDMPRHALYEGREALL